MQCSNCAKHSLIRLAKATKLRPIPQIRYFDQLPTRLQVWSLIFLVSEASWFFWISCQTPVTSSGSRCSCWQLIQKKPCSHPRTRLQWLRKIRLKIWRLQWIDMPPAWQASLFLKGVHWNNEVSTNQAYSSCFLFGISWILMEGLPTRLQVWNLTFAIDWRAASLAGVLISEGGPALK